MSLGKVKPCSKRSFFLHLTQNDHTTPYQAKLPCCSTHAGKRLEGWLAAEGPTRHSAERREARPSAPTAKACGECGAGKTLKGCEPSPVPPWPPSPALPTPEGERGSQEAAGGRAARAPSLPGRRGAARQGGRGSMRATTRATAPSRPARAGTPRLLLEAAAWGGALASQRGPEQGKGGKKKEETTCLRVPRPTPFIIRRTGRSALRHFLLSHSETFPFRPVAGTFVSLFLKLVRAGTDSKRATGNRPSGGAERWVVTRVPASWRLGGRLETPRGAAGAELRGLSVSSLLEGRPHNLRGGCVAPPERSS